MWTEKGNSSILEKRVLGRWDEFKAKNKHWTARRGGDPAEDNAHMFAAQPDFANQKTALHEAVISEISLTSQGQDDELHLPGRSIKIPGFRQSKVLTIQASMHHMRNLGTDEKANGARSSTFTSTHIMKLIPLTLPLKMYDKYMTFILLIAAN
ncbi:hypothetical protein DFQ28_005996 [Apophysomyces sp. BC1034]|nr:hypothetical protein DFQ28_005996 [Apophysomyces sp. BC1034]